MLDIYWKELDAYYKQFETLENEIKQSKNYFYKNNLRQEDLLLQYKEVGNSLKKLKGNLYRSLKNRQDEK
jgi:hypothetical protein